VLSIFLGGVCLKKSEPILQKIPTNETETMRTKFWQNYFLGKGFAKTSADSFFLNLDVASGGGGVWGGILRLLLFFLLAKFGRAYTFSLLLPIILVILYCGCLVGAYNNDTTI
jgi:hypothetical protein